MAIKYNSSPGLLNPKDLLIRHSIILMLSIIFGNIGHFEDPLNERMLLTLGNFINISLIWNGNIWLIDVLDKYFGWENKIYPKLLLSGIIAISWPVLIHFFYNIFLYPFIFGKPCDLSSKESTIYLIMSVSITLFINSIFVSIAFFRFWRSTIKEAEELKRESITAEFATLKNQINPHFLFNSLNTLTSLIEENPKTATDFVQKLSSVYRYILTQKDKELATLKEELQFVQSYIYLNQIRFGSNLQTHIHIESPYLEQKIVTLSLQMLIENCIKHNIVSKDKPLTVYIGVYNGKVFVRNNLQRKQIVTDSNGIGLNNIVHRYSLLTNESVEIMEDEKDFMVSLPLIKQS